MNAARREAAPVPYFFAAGLRAAPPAFFAPPDLDADERVDVFAPDALAPDAFVPDDLAAAGFFAADAFAVEARDDLAAPAFAPPDFAPVDFAAVERVDFAATGFAPDFAPPAFAAVERVDFAAAGFAADFAPDERDDAFAPADFVPEDLVPLDFAADDLDPLFFVAIFSNSFSLIDAAIGFDAPRSSLLGLSPLLADWVAPAASHQAGDVAGIFLSLPARERARR